MDCVNGNWNGKADELGFEVGVKPCSVIALVDDADSGCYCGQ